MIITADEQLLEGRKRPLKSNVDSALESILEQNKVDDFVVLIAKRTGKDLTPLNQRDKYLDEVLLLHLFNIIIIIMIIICSNIGLCHATTIHTFNFDIQQEMEKHPTFCDPEPMDADSPLFVMYTSGTTDQPAGIEHSTAGYLLYVALSHKVL